MHADMRWIEPCDRRQTTSMNSWKGWAMSEESSMCVHWYRTLYSWIASAMLVRMSMVFYA